MQDALALTWLQTPDRREELMNPVEPTLHEGFVKDARDYMRLAEAVNGPVAAPMAADYPWGDTLADLRRMAPNLHIVNLETGIAQGGTPWPGKASTTACIRSRWTACVRRSWPSTSRAVGAAGQCMDPAASGRALKVRHLLCSEPPGGPLTARQPDPLPVTPA